MRIQKIAMCLMLTGCLAFMASCTSPEEVTSESEEKVENADGEMEEKLPYFSGELTEEEREGEHLLLQLMEKITVDADITGDSEYSGGLKAYYVGNRREEKKIKNIKRFQKDPEINGMSLSEILKQIEKKSAGSFWLGKKEIQYNMEDGKTANFLIQIPCQDGKQEKKQIFMSGTVSKHVLSDFNLELTRENSGAYEETDGTGRYVAPEDSIGRDMLECFSEFDMSDLSFGDHEEIAGELKLLLEKIAGYELAEKYECMPVSQKNYQMVVGKENDLGKIVPVEGEYYTYFFYQAIDGFPWIGANITQSVSSDDGRSVESLTAFDEEEQTVTYGEDGIRELRISDYGMTGKVYQEVTPCGIDTVLQEIKKYFQAQNVILPTTVYDIGICYSGDFAENNDFVVKPFWYVSYMQENWDAVECDHLWLDVESGKCVKSSDW